ncbi:uncharacterized protein PHACADRAFT_190902 [Phanerochaete carnosa HHB-10118-sp]|uniref:Retrotransposon gag domain-containing protein n=1 Tax=Phanerochaete carnosa (strain HHB-10118-sp) TaxID=650164 RepID=K5WR30_PHACS|nr:uncharacterized protein PHACADRAFT_190902 [Phanerochaete carnosa HHB-10118-sp]EKM61719.1 hypothetical protein PHACADRAFT_190902 [Phanerochaete carnosa HHB-10118-sp]
MSITHHRQHQYGLQLLMSEVKDLQEEFPDNQEVEVEVDHQEEDHLEAEEDQSRAALGPNPIDPQLLAAFTAALRNALLQEEIGKPAEFSGDIEKARDFIHQCKMYILSKASQFPNDQAKICFADLLIKDSEKKQPRKWVTVKEKLYLLQRWPTWATHCQEFLEAYKTTDPKSRAMVELHQIVQKDHETVNEYNVHFNTLIAEAEIVNPDADGNLLQQYLRGLKKSLARQLIAHMPINATLSQWQQQALELDNRLGILRHIKNRQMHLPTNSGTTTTTPTSSTQNLGILPENAGNLSKQEEEEPTEEEETREAEAEEVEETGETTKAIHLQIAPTSKSFNGTEIQAPLIYQQSATQFR